MKLGSFQSSENIQKKEFGSDRSVSNTKFSSVTLNEPAMKARERMLKFVFNKSSIQRHIHPNGPNRKKLLTWSKPIIFSDLSEYFR